MERRPRSFYVLAAFFALFVLFLYGPTITIAILSFQGPQGGRTFPMRGWALHWFRELFEQQAVGDIWGSFSRSLVLGLMVMVTTVIVSVMGVSQAVRGRDHAVLSDHHLACDPINPGLAGRGADLVPVRPGGPLVHIGVRRTTDLDPALWSVEHVCGL